MKIEIEKNMLAGNLSLPIDGLSKDVQAIIKATQMATNVTATSLLLPSFQPWPQPWERRCV